MASIPAEPPFFDPSRIDPNFMFVSDRRPDLGIPPQAVPIHAPSSIEEAPPSPYTFDANSLADVENVEIIKGFSGGKAPGREATHTRLYLSLNKKRWLDIPNDAIRYFVYLYRQAPQMYPMGGTLVWVDQSAQVISGSAAATKTRFLSGPLAGAPASGGDWCASGGDWCASGGDWCASGGDWCASGGDWCRG